MLFARGSGQSMVCKEGMEVKWPWNFRDVCAEEVCCDMTEAPLNCVFDLMIIHINICGDREGERAGH